MAKVVSNIPVINGDFFRVANQGRILPYYKDTIFTAFGKNYFSSFLDVWADTEAVCVDEIFHVEENEFMYKVKPAADVTGSGPGDPATITIAPGSHALGGTHTIVQPDYVVVFPPLNKLGKVVSVDTDTDGAHEMVVVPFDDAYTISVKATEDILVIPFNLRKRCDTAEGKSSSIYPGVAFKSELMIAGKTLKICGSDLASWCEKLMLYKTMSPLDGCKEVEVWWHADLDLMFFEFMQAWAMMFMVGEAVNNDNVAIGEYKASVGFLNALRARAAFHPLSASDDVDLDDLDAITDLIKGRRGYCDQYGFWLGRNIRKDIDNAMGDRFVNGSISYGAFDGFEQKAISFGFDAIKKNGIEMYLHDEETFNDPGFLAADGFNGPNMMFGIPLCRMMCNGELKTPVVINYLANEKAGYSRELEQWDYGVLKPESNNQTFDGHTWQLRAEKGPEFWALDRYIFAEKL